MQNAGPKRACLPCGPWGAREYREVADPQFVVEVVEQEAFELVWQRAHAHYEA
jgi:hypothetical protein